MTWSDVFGVCVALIVSLLVWFVYPVFMGCATVWAVVKFVL